MKAAINLLIGGSRGPFFVTKTVKELLFDGYDDALLKVIRASNDPSFPKIPFDRMGWFYSRNNSETYDGKFRMFTGVDEITKLGNLQMWNGKPSTNLYRGNCSNVRGSTGELWAPIENNETPNLSIFASDICRNIDLKYESEVEKLGLKGHRWVADESVFDNGFKYPEMSCYCSANEELCPDLAPGVFNASSCKWSSPAFISFPHFYLADEVYLTNLTGMNPQKEKHQFTIALEPQTGIPLSVNAALQINLLIKPWHGITKFKDVPQLFAPILWFRQRAELTEELAKQARTATSLPSIGVYVAFGLMGAGILIAISAILCYTFNWRRMSEEDDDGQEQPILDD
jgi:scavenger receptor class B protein 1